MTNRATRIINSCDICGVMTEHTIDISQEECVIADYHICRQCCIKCDDYDICDVTQKFKKPQIKITVYEDGNGKMVTIEEFAELIKNLVKD